MSAEERPVYGPILAEHLAAEWDRQQEITDSPIADLYEDERTQVREAQELLDRYKPGSLDHDDQLRDISHYQARLDLLLRFHDIVNRVRRVNPASDPLAEDPVSCAMGYSCLMIASEAHRREPEHSEDLRWLLVEASNVYRLEEPDAISPESDDGSSG